MTGLYQADTPALLTRTLTHRVTALLATAAGDVLPLDLEAARTTFDGSRTPRVTARLTCRLPTDQSLLDRIDPRTATRVVLSAGYARPDGLDDVQPIADLALRSRYADRPSDTLEVALAGDEALFADGGPAAGITVNQSSLVNAIRFCVEDVLGPQTWNVTASSAGAAINEYTADTDRVDLVNDYRDRIGADVYVDEARVWNIANAPALAATPNHTMTVGAAGTITASNAGLDRELDGPDGWYNRVYLLYRWRDAGGVEQTVATSRSVTTGPYSVTGNLRTLRVERKVATTLAQAGTVAANMVARTVTRGRTFTVTGVAAYWLRPGMTVAVQLPIGGLELHLVTAVTFDHFAGLMTVTTRLPDNAGTIA